MAEERLLFRCPECTLMMSELRREVSYHPSAIHWMCWRCDHRFGVTEGDGEITDFGVITERP